MELVKIIFHYIFEPIAQTLLMLAVFMFCLHLAIYFNPWFWLAVGFAVLGMSADRALNKMREDEEKEKANT